MSAFRNLQNRAKIYLCPEQQQLLCCYNLCRISNDFSRCDAFFRALNLRQVYLFFRTFPPKSQNILCFFPDFKIFLPNAQNRKFPCETQRPKKKTILYKGCTKLVPLRVWNQHLKENKNIFYQCGVLVDPISVLNDFSRQHRYLLDY